MSAKLASSGNTPLSALGNLAGLANRGQQGGGIPFRIQGTTSNPVFVPDLAGLASGLGGGAASGTASDGKAALPTGQDLGEALGGIFGRRKQ